MLTMDLALLILLLVKTLGHHTCFSAFVELDTAEDFNSEWEESVCIYVDTYFSFEIGTGCNIDGSTMEPIDLTAGDTEGNRGYWATCPGTSCYLAYKMPRMSQEFPSSVYIRGFFSPVPKYEGDETLIIFYLGDPIVTQTLDAGKSWFEFKYPIPFHRPEMSIGLAIIGGFVMIDKIILEIPELPNRISRFSNKGMKTNCMYEPDEYRCESIDQFDQTWIGCLGEFVYKLCPCGSIKEHASWFCSTSGEFVNETPDFTQCSSPGLQDWNCTVVILDTEKDALDGKWDTSLCGYSDAYDTFESNSDCGLEQLPPGSIDDEVNSGYWAVCSSDFGLSCNIEYGLSLYSHPDFIYLRGFTSTISQTYKVELRVSAGNETIIQSLSGLTWFEFSYPIPFPKEEQSVHISTRVLNQRGFIMLDKILLGFPETEEAQTNATESSTSIQTSTEQLSTCENNPAYRCEAIDQYGRFWNGCFGEVVIKMCSDSSTSHASWLCSYDGKFATESPDYSGCSSNWLEIIHDEVEGVEIVPQESAIEWIETMDNITKMALETSNSLYFGHEIKTICTVAEELFTKLDKNTSISVLEDLASKTAEIFYRVLINPNSWKDVTSEAFSAYRSATGTAFLQTIQTAVLRLNQQEDAADSYELLEHPELQIETHRVKSDSNSSLIYPSNLLQNQTYIEIPPSWKTFFPDASVVGFVGIQINNENARKLLPVIQEKAGENFQIIGEELTFTFEGNQEISFIEEGVKIYFKHVNPLEMLKAKGPSSRRFPIPEPTNSTQIIKKCVFWDFRRNSWSSDGCVLRENDETHSICECQHLSSFAVLFDVNNIVSDEKPLEIISWILSIISIACLLLTVYVYSQSYVQTNRSPRTTITRHLSISLLVAHVGLLLSIDTNNISPSVGFCSAIGAITHFAFLCSFAWMGFEGFVLYRAIFVVFETANREPKWVQYLIGYGVPALIVVITGIIGISKSESPYHSLTETDCWLAKDYIWAFIGPASLIILVNFILLIFSVRKAHQLTNNPKIAVNRQKRQTFGTMVTGSISLSIILGLTWIFGYLVLINDTSIALPAAYLFTLLNASQGIFIFLFHVLTNTSIKKHFGRELDKLNMNMAGSSKGFTSQSSTKQTKY